MLSNKKLFLFDIDGTVCQGERLIDGTMQFLEDIRQSGGQFVFITNNSTKSIQDYILKFQKLGIKTDYRNFITASYATIHYLKKNYDEASANPKFKALVSKLHLTEEEALTRTTKLLDILNEYHQHMVCAILIL